MRRRHLGDQELLSAWRAGDVEAGEELVRKHNPRLIRFFRARPELSHRAEDLAQDVWAAVLSRRDEIRTSIGGYLTAVAFNKLRYSLRRFDVGVVQEEVLPTLEPDPLCVLLEKFDHDLVARALRELDMMDQILMQMRFFEGMTLMEIGEAIDRPTGTIHRIVAAALVRLRQQIEDVESRMLVRSRWRTLASWRERVSRSIRRRFG